ncbi:hypothetical protein Adt_05850 [Abeliophyllum distichum]|uniref:Uncharacterized protein n=1 Tax=Abeliophyllum distichum TaxID=126358 RepID=A0ABD1V586_9LAMI
MSSTNNKLGFENIALWSKVGTLVLDQAVLKIKIDATTEDVRRAKKRVLEAQNMKKMVEDARKWAKERATVAEQTIASVTQDFDNMVLEKDKQLARAMDKLVRTKEELATVKASMAKAKVSAVRLYKKKFSSTPKYTYLTTRFMEAGGNQLTENIKAVQPDWDLSFLQSTSAETPAPMPSTTFEVPPFVEPHAGGESPIPSHPIVEEPIFADAEEVVGQ